MSACVSDVRCLIDWTRRILHTFGRANPFALRSNPMTPAPSLQDLLDRTRLAWRAARARRVVAWAAVIVAGCALLVGPGYGIAPLLAAAFVMLLVGAIAWMRNAPDDLQVAQFIDARLQNHDLLASGVACRAKDDEASQLIVAQAEQFAASVDRSRLSILPFLSRLEVAAALSLCLSAAVVQSGIVHPRMPSESRAQHERPSAPSDQAATHPPAPSPDSPRDSSRSDRAADSPETSDRTGVRERAGNTASGGDAQGSAAQSSSTRRPPPTTPRGTPGSTGTDAAGTGQSSTHSASAGPLSNDGPQVRAPLNLGEIAPPDPAARDLARRMLADNTVDFDSRDLVRAYFDLDDDQ